VQRSSNVSDFFLPSTISPASNLVCRTPEVSALDQWLAGFDARPYFISVAGEAGREPAPVLAVEVGIDHPNRRRMQPDVAVRAKSFTV
jgi:hypothetical protein